jgi:hypothetical protein
MLSIFTSTRADGSMKPLAKTEIELVRQVRATFLERNDIQPDDTTCVRLEYVGDDYCRYMTIDSRYKGDGITRDSSIIVDALVVTKPRHALLLPLADCVGAVLHDASKGILMVSHLGRHNLEQQGGLESVRYLERNHGVDPKDLSVWLSPAAGAEPYPLFSFSNRGLQEVASEQLIAAGVLQENISAPPIDVAKDDDYYSHSQFLKGNRPDDGRFVIVAVMQEDVHAKA